MLAQPSHNCAYEEYAVGDQFFVDDHHLTIMHVGPLGQGENAWESQMVRLQDEDGHRESLSGIAFAYRLVKARAQLVPIGSAPHRKNDPENKPQAPWSRRGRQAARGCWTADLQTRRPLPPRNPKHA